MNIRHVWLLMKNEILHGPKDVFLIMAVVIPLMLTLLVNLAAGEIFSGNPKLGIYDEGDSALTPILKANPALIVKIYHSESQLKEAAGRGSVDVGMVLPVNFDRRVESGSVDMTVFIWGESKAKSRTIVPVLLAGAVRQMESSEIPVKVNTIALGRETSQPWSNRLLPLTLLMAVFFGGLMIPASSLVNEKIHHTIEALFVTPASLSEIFLAKGLTGLALAACMGILTMLISRSIDSSFPLVILILVLGAAMAAGFGLLAGALIKDMNTLFTFWKFGGLLLFGPALIYMFPQIPQWIGYVFPTYYFVKPIVDLSLNNAGFGDIAIYAAVLIILITALLIVVNSLVRKMSTRDLKVGA